MIVFSGRTIASLCLLIFSLPNHSCRYNRKYLPLNRRIIENVTLHNYRHKFAGINLQHEPNVEFKYSHFPLFGEALFRELNDSTKSLTFRRGSVKEIVISSPALKVLQVINTGLVSLEAIPSLDYNLRHLTVRSAEFSQWPSSLAFLKNLEEVDISYCNFDYLSMDWFAAFPKLRVLDVAKNRLAALNIDPALIMERLQKLHLWGNRLSELQRFPDAFPQLDGVSLSQNRWHCGWLAKARDAIWSVGVVLMDMDGVCQPGWVNNGGLCCRSSVIWRTNVPKRKTTAEDIDLQMQKLAEDLGGATVVDGMRMGKTVVYLDQPLPA